MSKSYYTTEALIRSMTPLNSVIDSFALGTNDIINSQAKFVSLIVSISKQCKDISIINDANIKVEEEEVIIDWSAITFLPSRRYIQKLLQQYITKLEESNIELQDDNLASLVCYFSMTKCSTLPDPTSLSLVTFRIPKSNNSMKSNNNDTSPSTNNDDDDDTIQIRTYPYHNDVGVAKVWEAGACLAEYIIFNPHCVEDKNVVELGAGVGLTGLIASAYKAKSVNMTDYTEVCLDNLSYNVDINEEWLRKRGVLPETVTVGKLEWGDYSNMQNGNELIDASEQSSIEAISKADVLLAADVVYDVNCIPDLVSTVSKFLNQAAGSERIALFATTYRNERTFGIFEKQLKKHQIICEYEQSLEHLPNIFPCYWNQSRSDVRVCTMRKK